MNEFKSELKQPVTVLLIETDVIQNFFITEFLEAAGFKVFDVATTEEAMATLQTHSNINAVIVEYVPSPPTDASLVQIIAVQFPCAALFVTIDQAIIPAGLPPSAKVLTKPFEPELVIEVLRRLVG